MPTLELSPALLPDVLAQKVAVDGNGCWRWTAYCMPNGYGTVRYGGGPKQYAHRLVHVLLIGEIPDDYEVDHLCRVRNCVNPAHLEAVTHAENCRRQALAKTHCAQGHPYDENNTHLTTDDNGERRWRKCRACGRERMRRYKAANREEK